MIKSTVYYKSSQKNLTQIFKKYFKPDGPLNWREQDGCRKNSFSLSLPLSLSLAVIPLERFDAGCQTKHTRHGKNSQRCHRGSHCILRQRRVSD